MVSGVVFELDVGADFSLDVVGGEPEGVVFGETVDGEGGAAGYRGDGCGRGGRRLRGYQGG